MGGVNAGSGRVPRALALHALIDNVGISNIGCEMLLVLFSPLIFVVVVVVVVVVVDISNQCIGCFASSFLIITFHCVLYPIK